MVPSVLGTISEMIRIARVSTAEITPNQRLPKISVASAPAPAAPTVWAMVLSVRIAEMGCSMRPRRASMRRPEGRPASASTCRCESGTDSSTASHMEHRNEMESATPT